MTTEYVRWFGRLWRLLEVNTDGTATIEAIKEPKQTARVKMMNLDPTPVRRIK